MKFSFENIVVSLLFLIVSMTQAASSYQVFGNSSWGEFDSFVSQKGSHQVSGWGASFGVSYTDNIELAGLYLFEFMSLAGAESIVRQVFLPEVGIAFYKAQYLELNLNTGVGAEYFYQEYAYQGPTGGLPQEPLPETRSQLNPLVSVGLEQQLFYDFLGVSVGQRLSYNLEGISTTLLMGLILKIK